MGRQKKAAKEKDAKEPEESSVSNESGKRWMSKFSTMKVGPPKGAKAVMGFTNMKGKLGWERRWLAKGGWSGQQEWKPKRGLNNIVSHLTVVHGLTDT